MFFPNTNSLGYQPFKGTNWALVFGLLLRDTIKGLLLVLCPFLILTFRLVSWVCAPIISNPIKNNILHLSSVPKDVGYAEQHNNILYMCMYVGLFSYRYLCQKSIIHTYGP